jgi:hypothetical protein
MLRTVLACLCFAALAGPALAADARRHSFSFAVLGDTPYFAWEALRLEQLLEELNGEDLAFVLHVGDIKSGRDRCDDKLYADRRALFQRSRHAFVLLPGDNDWTDCHRASNGGFDPLERLESFRRVFYPDSLSLGQQPIALERQSEDADFAAYRENVRWRVGAVVFAVVHVVGSGNNYGSARDSEFAARTAANLAWLAQAFEQAASAHTDALVVAIHGNPLLEATPGSPRRAGFDDFVRRLEEGATALGKPVLLVHGDTHRFQWDRPHPAIRRLESFGSPGVGWVRVTVQPDATELFGVEPNP